MPSSDSISNHPNQFAGKPPLRTDDLDALLAIEPSVLQGLVQFRRPALLRTFHETYASDEYDRTSIQVARRKLALPERGERVYYKKTDGGDAVAELDELVTRGRQLTVRDNFRPDAPRTSSTARVRDASSSPSSPPLRPTSPPLRPTTPVAGLVDSDSDDDTPTQDRRRPGTPLPSLFLDASDSEDEDGSAVHCSTKLCSPLRMVVGPNDSDESVSPVSEAVHPDGVAKDAYFEVHRTSKPVDIRRSQWSAVVDATDGTPRSYASSSSSSSDESEGPMTPRQRPVLVSSPPSDSEFSWKYALSDTDGCLGGF